MFQPVGKISTSTEMIIEQQEVMNAEALMPVMVMFLVDHHLPLSVAEHFSPLLRAMFPANKIADKFSCCRTKATCLYF